MVANAFNPNTWKGEVGRSLWVEASWEFQENQSTLRPCLQKKKKEKELRGVQRKGKDACHHFLQHNFNL